MATIQKINATNRNIVPGIGQENNIFVKSGDVNPLIDQVNINTAAIADIADGNFKFDHIAENTSGHGVTFDNTINTPATINSATQASAIKIKDNEAAALDIMEGTNSYLKFTSTNGAEKIVASKLVETGGTLNTNSIGELTSGNGVTIDGVLIKDAAFDTNVAAAGVTLSGTTLAADGTDAAIPITITPKGVAGILTAAGSAAKPAYSFTGDSDSGIISGGANVVTLVTNATEQWSVNASGSLVPNVSTNDIGSTGAAVQKVYSQNEIVKATDANGFYGLMTRKYVAAKATLGAEPTEITVGIPAGVRLLAVQFTVSTEITAATATSWKASFTGGSTAVIDGGTNAFALNTKLNVLLSETTMAATAVTTDVTQISIISNDASDFTSGEISAIVYYEELTSITN